MGNLLTLRTRIEAYDMEQLPKIMEEIRKDTSTEGRSYVGDVGLIGSYGV
jgi:hypothetical protein